MRKLLVPLFFVTLMVLGAGAVLSFQTPNPTGMTVRGTVANFVPITDAMLRSPAAADWIMLRHDYGATSFSALEQITTGNVKNLQLAWMWPMHEGGTNQPAPVVYNGTLYLANTGGIVQALEARTGKPIWEYRVGADVAPRGLVLYRNMLIFHSMARWAVSPQDAFLVALDARNRRVDLESTDAGCVCQQQWSAHRQWAAHPGNGHMHGFRREEMFHQCLQSVERQAGLAF
jgi:glucose dehydrogenase